MHSSGGDFQTDTVGKWGSLGLPTGKGSLRGQSVPDPDQVAWNSLPASSPLGEETEGRREEFEAGWVGALSSLFAINNQQGCLI